MWPFTDDGWHIVHDAEMLDKRITQVLQVIDHPDCDKPTLSLILIYNDDINNTYGFYHLMFTGFDHPVCDNWPYPFFDHHCAQRPHISYSKDNFLNPQ